MALSGATPWRLLGAICLAAVVSAGVTAAGSTAPIGSTAGDPTGASGPGVGERPAQGIADESSIAFVQQTFGNVFLANETVRIGVETGAPEVRWTVHDYRGRLVANGTAAVDGDRTLTLPVTDVGHYTVRARTTTAPVRATRTTMAVLPADDFDNDDAFYGMSTQFNAGWDHELMAIMDRAGVATVREDSGWAGIEQSPGEYDFSSSDGYVDPLGDRGFDRLYILAYGNPLHDPNGGEYFTMPYTDAYRRAFANFSRASVRHYDGVDHVEVWNEPNLEGFAAGPAGTDPAAYAALLEATYPAVHAEREDVTVVGGSATGNYSGTAPTTLDRPWWEGLLAAGGARHMDAMAIHLYREEPVGFDEDLAELRALTREHNDGETLPVWVTELGWHTTPTYPGGDREAMQARYLVRSHARLQAAGVERYYWYTLQDTVFDGESSPQTDAGSEQFGLLRRHDNPYGGNTPKPGLVAYAVMTRQLAGEDFVAAESDPVERYTFANGSGRTHVLWSDDRTDVTVHTDDPVTVTSATGDETRLTPRNGEVYLTVSRDPLYVAGDVANVTRGAPVSVTGPVRTDAPEEVTVGVTAGTDSRTVTHRVSEATVTVSAQSGSTATATLDVPPAYRERAAVAVDVVSVDGRPVGRLTAPVGAPTARLGDPAEFAGLTLETFNDSAGWFTEANDVGTRYSQFDVRTRQGRACWESDVDAGRPGLGWYVDVADGHADALGDTVPVTVTYYDAGDGELVAQYDGPAEDATWGGTLELGDTGEWRTHTFELRDAQFADGLGAGHDFRLMLVPDAGDVCLGSIAVGTAAVDPPVAPVDNGSVTPETTATNDGDERRTGNDETSQDSTPASGDGDTAAPDRTPTAGTDSGAASTARNGSGFGYLAWAVGVLVAGGLAALRHRRTG